MDRSTFEVHLRAAVIGAFRDFCDQYAAESPYAFAIIEGQCGNYLGYAIATEEGLHRVAGAHPDTTLGNAPILSVLDPRR